MTLINTYFSRRIWKISVSAKNARRSGSCASYGTQVLTYGEYVLFKGNSGFYLNSCDVLGIIITTQDLVCFTHAAHNFEMKIRRRILPYRPYSYIAAVCPSGIK